MINKFTSFLSEHHINIARMYNNSLDDIAYTIFDLDNEINKEIKENLEKVDGVLRVRVLKGNE